ncbi:hypothetical protein OTU49_006932 [Cherax quadricarinatus]|uniref:Secreted protein n=1 Tax=Cherax quadricarinatus TaxID=27406 RepID=A0AAW0Y7G0_CHEQU
MSDTLFCALFCMGLLRLVLTQQLVYEVGATLTACNLHNASDLMTDKLLPKPINYVFPLSLVAHNVSLFCLSSILRCAQDYLGRDEEMVLLNLVFYVFYRRDF